MSYSRAASFLKEIVIIVYSLAFANGILYFLQVSEFHPRESPDFNCQEILFFLCFLVTLVRFIHGNLAYLAGTYEIPRPGTKMGAWRVVVDFIFIITQAFLFSMLSVYQLRPHLFVWIFAVLFFFDGIWFSLSSLLCHSTHPHDGKQKDYLNHWAIVNIITAVGLFLTIYAFEIREATAEGKTSAMGTQSAIFSILFSGVILGNAAIDYILNRSFYFPFPHQDEKKGHKVFLSARLTKAIKKDGIFDPGTRQAVSAVVNRLKEKGLTVFSAHLVEDFGQTKVEPEEFAPRDFKEICEADSVVVLFDEPISAGTCIEIGWATALQKPVVVFSPEVFYIATEAPMLLGLRQISKVRIERYKDVESLLAKVDGYFSEIA
jgi:nucleoside 2-deoxyribosyltransferase